MKTSYNLSSFRTIGLCCALLAAMGMSAVVRGADAKVAPKDAKAAKAETVSTNKEPWKVALPVSVFVADVKDRTKFKGFTDPFFPKTTRIFPKPPPPPPPKPTGPGKPENDHGKTPESGDPVPPPPPPPPKWYLEFSVSGILGGRLAIVQVGGDAYNFREGKTLEVITAKGPAKVTCVKIAAESVELRMAGEKDPGILELP